MRLHEYEAKDIFADYDIPTPKGGLVKTSEEAVEKAKEIGLPVVIKSQVLVGGRGLAGGIKFAESAEDVQCEAEAILNTPIKGYQPDGILIEKKLDIATELYLGITIDGIAGCPVIMVSSEGGVAVEETAAKSPEKIASVHTNVFLGLQSYQTRKLTKGLGLSGEGLSQVADILLKLYKVFEDYDALIAEINPLVVANDGAIYAADAVLEIDDSALYKYPEFQKKALSRIPDDLEKEAKEIGVSYVGLDGDIGLICSGAGLGMASIDMIKSQGEPANFLETGGGITQELMNKALRLVLKKPGVRAVFINLYGGINPIHEGAKGIVEVIREDNVTIPIIAKAHGNFQEETWATLESAGVKVVKQTQTGKAVEELFRVIGSVMSDE
ncbi:succinate-CoA ligase subunit beta [Candidatus Poribacteria bacterium]|nr:succinate-CoA ligase subunit beta [Candidatus Poribacteria bacterium]